MDNTIRILVEQIERLNKQIESLNEDIQSLKIQNTLLSEQVRKQNIWNTPLQPVNNCSVCGIRLDTVTGYCCPRTNCPTGLGPITCKTLS